MTGDSLLAVIAFAFVNSITPYPNNLMLMASRANFGVRRTVPHMLGAAPGLVFMTVFVGIGSAQVLVTVPGLDGVLKAASGIYLRYRAGRVTTVPTPGGPSRWGRPTTFLAAAFQWRGWPEWPCCPKW